MTVNMPISRRGFLGGLITFLGAVGFTGLARSLAKMPGPDGIDSLPAKLATFFVHKDSAAVLGLEYLRSRPKEADAQVLVDLISGPLERVELTEAGLETVRELLRIQQRQDFERGRVVRVQGWILSETEARLCALAALV